MEVPDFLRAIEEFEYFISVAMKAYSSGNMQAFSTAISRARSIIDKVEPYIKEPWEKKILDEKKYKINKISMEAFFVEAFATGILLYSFTGKEDWIEFLERNFSVFQFEFFDNMANPFYRYPTHTN